jgi:phosphatidylglycerophosphatase C
MHAPLPLSPEALAVVAPLLEKPAAPGAAVAFDADGTLWRGDVGEELLRELVAQDRLPRWRGRRDLYQVYEEKVAQDPATGYAFAAEAMADWEEAALQDYCRDFFRRQMASQLFPFTAPLLRALAAAGHEIWVVSASAVWPVIPGAAWLDVPPERVIAVQVEVEGGRLTARSRRPVPAGEGKVELLKARGVRPVLAVGNGNLDEPMLAYAERALVVAPFGQDNGLVKAAARRGWPVQRG